MQFHSVLFNFFYKFLRTIKIQCFSELKGLEQMFVLNCWGRFYKCFLPKLLIWKFLRIKLNCFNPCFHSQTFQKLCKSLFWSANFKETEQEDLILYSQCNFIFYCLIFITKFLRTIKIQWFSELKGLEQMFVLNCWGPILQMFFYQNYWSESFSE